MTSQASVAAWIGRAHSDSNQGTLRHRLLLGGAESVPLFQDEHSATPGAGVNCGRRHRVDCHGADDLVGEAVAEATPAGGAVRALEDAAAARSRNTVYQQALDVKIAQTAERPVRSAIDTGPDSSDAGSRIECCRTVRVNRQGDDIAPFRPVAGPGWETLRRRHSRRAQS